MKLRAAWILIAAAVGVPSSAWALQFDWDFGGRFTVGAQAETPGDLGRGDAHDDQGVFLDANPFVSFKYGDDWAGYLRLRAFLPTNSVEVEQDGVIEKADSFVALREAWVSYGGLTSYPGEFLRVGRQRLREDDAAWLDQDAESLRWVFDTTLLKAEAGVAEQFDAYRTDDIDLPVQQKDRAFAFASANWQWRQGDWVGMRAMHAHDHGGLPDEGHVVRPPEKLVDGDLTWVGLNVNRGFFDPHGGGALSYWAEVTGLFGQQDVAVPSAADADGVVTIEGRNRQDVRAVAADAGVRVRMPWKPMQVGVAYSYGQGGSGSDDSHEFVQTGLQSNFSRFTGTRAPVTRYNDALRADLQNLKIATVFASLYYPTVDASLVYHHFTRDDRDAVIRTRGVDADPALGGSNDIGDGVDLVLTWYWEGLGQTHLPVYDFDQDSYAYLRLRGSLFDPGKAYGHGADADYRVVLEGTLWY